MKPVQTYRGDWVVQFWDGTARPGVFDSEETAKQSMYLTAQKVQSIYVPTRDGGSPLTMAQILAAFP